MGHKELYPVNFCSDEMGKADILGRARYRCVSHDYMENYLRLPFRLPGSSIEVGRALTNLSQDLIAYRILKLI
jgi:hypothetical protein